MSAKSPIPLLPCPWCGSDDVELDWVTDDEQAVGCKKCGAEGPCFNQNIETDQPTTENAVAAWNKGPYADRHEIHAAALKAHADQLRAQAAEHLAKADELLAKAEGSTP